MSGGQLHATSQQDFEPPRSAHMAPPHVGKDYRSTCRAAEQAVNRQHREPGGLVASAVIYSAVGGSSGLLVLGFLAISGVTMIGSLFTFVVQWQSAQRDSAQLLKLYKAYVDDTRNRLATLEAVETTERRNLEPPVVQAIQQAQAHPERLWQRTPNDPDFLSVRVGVGDTHPFFDVSLPEQAKTIALPSKDAPVKREWERADKFGGAISGDQASDDDSLAA